MSKKCQLLLVAGVSGSGKSTIGSMLASQVGWEFHDGDSYHPPENVAKMRSGMPLDDADRVPWLAAMRAAIEACLRDGRGAVFVASALKEAYRSALCDGLDGIGLVFLHGDFELIRSRMTSRKDHYMPADLLQSQFDLIEWPRGALEVDVRATPEEAVRTIRAHFGM
ncbi:MAG TPA: gluconokinase [Opitutaceae bacterium]|nr:gluconokinase [Opitutaceae bacterium]